MCARRAAAGTTRCVVRLDADRAELDPPLERGVEERERETEGWRISLSLLL